MAPGELGCCSSQTTSIIIALSIPGINREIVSGLLAVAPPFVKFIIGFLKSHPFTETHPKTQSEDAKLAVREFDPLSLVFPAHISVLTSPPWLIAVIKIKFSLP